MIFVMGPTDTVGLDWVKVGDLHLTELLTKHCSFWLGQAPVETGWEPEESLCSLVFHNFQGWKRFYWSSQAWETMPHLEDRRNKSETSSGKCWC